MADVSEAEGDREVPICPSIPSGEQTVWADASSVLQLACNDLRDGELIHAENFNLFAAMSALEIMDPKMDSGMVRTYYSVDEAIEYGAAPIPLSFDKTVDVQRVIDIMDHLLACEATWHKGCSLAQTVFSCLYLLRPDRTSSHALLHSYCRVMRATCNAVVCTVSDTRTNEEEDLFTMTHGLPLKVDGDDKCLTMLHAVEETIARQLRACKATLSKKRVTEDIEPLQNNPDMEEGFCKSLLCRLRFRKHFYHVVTNMKRPQGRGLELAKKHIACCFEELESMIKSAEFLKSINAPGTLEDGMNNETTASGCQPVGFDSTLNSRLSAPTPPRAIETISWKKAAEYFQKLLHELDIICSYSLDPVFEGVLRFVVEFQKFQPELVARAHLQHLLVQDGKLYGRDSVFAVICKASLLPEVAKNHDIQKNETVVQLGQLLITLLRVLCTNISWQRRKLGKILQDWRIIHVQLELAFRKECGDISATSSNENICMKICRQILIWVEEQTYWIASRFLMLGFELDLYSTGEYCMVYWYMYIILIKLAERTHMRAMTSNEISKKKGKKKRDLVKDGGKDNQLPPAILFLQCHVYLAEGLTMMLAALRNERKIYLSTGPFNSEHERFVQHFELLLKACLPDQVSYYSFEETTAHACLSSLSMYNCFKETQRIAKELRSSFSNDSDKMAELRRIEQVAEHNSVALSLISRLGAVDASLKVQFEFSHHPFFASVVVKRS
ncbi:N-alpha-acetyltransferase 35, NatC auxiliary subunit [Solanum pennellii]|uniref:N-alpha-acetyltransferase 35, NatC auxiliary subunit n=1 Tax=Solanum pennellii TaxID=28526 RepID=A0ABM1H9T0_SOLPN|nr:N-alpha-acetyltransferase 35, NatC auxiliary subunit [Solanum pennellii]